MKKYLLIYKNKRLETVSAEENAIVLNGKTVISKTAEKIISVMFFSENKFAVFYEDLEGYGKIIIYGDGKVYSERRILNMKNFLQTDILLEQQNIKIFVSEKVNGKNVLKYSDMYAEKVQTYVLCENVVPVGEKLFKLSEENGKKICVFSDGERLNVHILGENRRIFVDKKQIKDYCVCIKNRKIYIFCLLKNNSVLYIFNEKSEVRQINIFNGTTAEKVFMAVYGENIFVAAKEKQWIFFRYADEKELDFLPMGKAYLKKYETVNLISFENIACGEFPSDSRTEFLMKNIFNNKEKNSKPIVSQSSRPDGNAFNIELSRELKKAVSEKGILNLRLKNMQEKFLAIEDTLKKGLETAEKNFSDEKEKNKKLEKENNMLEEENIRLKEENTILKKAQKLLEEEVYNLNTKVYECIDIPEENITEI